MVLNPTSSLPASRIDHVFAHRGPALVLRDAVQASGQLGPLRRPDPSLLLASPL